MTWPVLEPNFGSFQWLELSVGKYLDYPFNSDEWDEEDARFVSYVVQRGVWLFYCPPPIDGAPHIWSFLKRKGTITLVNEQVAYDMPADYGGGFCDPTYSEGDASRRLRLSSHHHIRALHSRDQQDGLPFTIGIRPKAIDLTAEDTFEALVYPRPTTVTIPASGVIEFFYRVNHAVLTTTNLYPLGTRTHAETILSACLAVAEECATKGEQSSMYQRFLSKLGGSLQMDRWDSQDGDVTGEQPDLMKQK